MAYQQRLAQIFLDSGGVLVIAGLYTENTDTLLSVCYFSRTLVGMAKVGMMSSAAPCRDVYVCDEEKVLLGRKDR